MCVQISSYWYTLSILYNQRVEQMTMTLEYDVREIMNLNNGYVKLIDKMVVTVYRRISVLVVWIIMLSRLQK